MSQPSSYVIHCVKKKFNCVISFLCISDEILYATFFLFFQREKQAPCREPEVGLHPGSPGSHPRPKADTKLLSHPEIPLSWAFKNFF